MAWNVSIPSLTFVLGASPLVMVRDSGARLRASFPTPLEPAAMLVPKQDRIKIYQTLFKEGVLVAKKAPAIGTVANVALPDCRPSGAVLPRLAEASRGTPRLPARDVGTTLELNGAHPKIEDTKNLYVIKSRVPHHAPWVRLHLSTFPHHQSGLPLPACLPTALYPPTPALPLTALGSYHRYGALVVRLAPGPWSGFMPASTTPAASELSPTPCGCRSLPASCPPSALSFGTRLVALSSPTLISVPTEPVFVSVSVCAGCPAVGRASYALPVGLALVVACFGRQCGHWSVTVHISVGALRQTQPPTCGSGDTGAWACLQLGSLFHTNSSQLMQGFESKGFVKERFAWRHYYWYLTDDGVNYLREYLHLPDGIVPTTHKKTVRSAGAGGPPGRGMVRRVAAEAAAVVTVVAVVVMMATAANRAVRVVLAGVARLPLPQLPL
eukprot:gene3410-647_t